MVVREMLKRSSLQAVCCVLMVLSACVGAASALASPQEQDSGVAHRVALGSTSGQPGTAVVVPIYFTPSPGTRVGYLKIGVNFVSRNLQYTKIERGVAAEFGHVDLKAEIKDSKNEQGLEISDLTIETSFTSPEPPPQGINSGLLGYINFQIKESAGPAAITLRVSAEGKELGTDKLIQNMSLAEGQVMVIEEGSQPAVLCFFFSH